MDPFNSDFPHTMQPTLTTSDYVAGAQHWLDRCSPGSAAIALLSRPPGLVFDPFSEVLEGIYRVVTREGGLFVFGKGGGISKVWSCEWDEIGVWAAGKYGRPHKTDHELQPPLYGAGNGGGDAMPARIQEFLILAYTRPGDIVLSLFDKSGLADVICRRHNRLCLIIQPGATPATNPLEAEVDPLQPIRDLSEADLYAAPWLAPEAKKWVFAFKVKAKGAAQNHECWIGPWACNSSGYGVVKMAGRAYYAHRIALSLVRGRPIPPALVAAHKCGNRACCNPAHLFVSDGDGNQLEKEWRVASPAEAPGE